MRRLAARHSTGIMEGNGSEMSQPPSAVESAAEPSASSSRNDAEGNGFIDTDLIEEIKKYPVLFKNARKENVYRKRMEKNIIWIEICDSLFKNWKSYPLQKKRDTMKEIQSRWVNLKKEFFMRQDGVEPDSPVAKKNKTVFESMSFLLQSTTAQDLEMGAYSQTEFAPILDPVIQGPPEGDINVGIPTLPIPPSAVFNLGVPSTSSVAPLEPISDNPNMHFALMLVPLLNRLSSEQLHATWPEILRVIGEAEGRKKLQILQHELVYPPGVEPVLEPVPEPAEEAAEEEPVYPSSHGRPRNPEGEIMYPETDNEDDVV